MKKGVEVEGYPRLSKQKHTFKKWSPLALKSIHASASQSSSKIAVALIKIVSSTLACNPASAIAGPECAPMREGLCMFQSVSPPPQPSTKE